MKIALFGKGYNHQHQEYLQILIDELYRSEFEVLFYEPYLQSIIDQLKFPSPPKTFTNYHEVKSGVDMLFSVGGDGTILDTVPFVRDSGVPILGINLGRMGFLSSISKNEIVEAVQNVRRGDYLLDKRTLLQLDAPRDLFGELNFALNDLTIYRNANAALIVIHVFVDDIFLNSYYGDGLIVATPTGSTAYSLSVGGPILVPGSQNFIISPIASHNLTVRPIVIHDSSTIKIQIEGREEKYLMNLDSRNSAIGKTDEIVIHKCDFQINLVRMPNKNFFSTIRDKLFWGVDYRKQGTNYYT
ncbi:MAG: NAD kinase [Bacteroidales bacterium]|jgi:NAD+ kinase|nr:NAD kinase [Bacteroidales bacterium]